MRSDHIAAAMAALLVSNAIAQSETLLTAISHIPKLSTFSTVVTASGGAQPNPAFEERFNSALDRRNYTAFAPTNEAFAKIQPAALQALLAAPSYPIFEAIVRTHIAEGYFTAANVVARSPIEAIEFTLTAEAVGKNIVINNQARIVAADVLASNGVIHQIDQVINPFTDYFGIGNASAAPVVTEVGGSMADVVLSDKRLSTLSEVLRTIAPDLIVRLRLGNKQQIYIAPSNDAFNVLPNGSHSAIKAPSNVAISSYLLESGLVDTPANLDFSAGQISIPSLNSGINITVTRAEGGATFVNNAAVQAQVRASDGCVWIVDRLLDPLYLMFGPEGVRK